MTTRRDFLKTGVGAAAGIVFCSCGLQQSAQAHSSRRARPCPSASTASGSRSSTCTPIAISTRPARCSATTAPKVQIPPVNGAEEAFIEVEKRLAAMDAQAVDMEVLSINPFWYGRDRDLAAKIVKIQNEKLAELCASKPDRFAGFASLTLQAPDLAVQELETAVKKQGLKGAGDRRPRRRHGILRSEIPSGMGQGRRTRRAALHSSAGPARAQQAACGQRMAAQRHRQSPGHDDRAVAHDLRRHLRPLPGAEGDRRAWRRLSRLLCRPFRPCLPGRAEGLQPRHQAEEEADRISEADLFRLAGLRARSDPPSGGAGRRQPDRAGQRLSL